MSSRMFVHMSVHMSAHTRIHSLPNFRYKRWEPVLPARCCRRVCESLSQRASHPPTAARAQHRRYDTLSSDLHAPSTGRNTASTRAAAEQWLASVVWMWHRRWEGACESSVMGRGMWDIGAPSLQQKIEKSTIFIMGPCDDGRSTKNLWDALVSPLPSGQELPALELRSFTLPPARWVRAYGALLIPPPLSPHSGDHPN